MFAKRTNWNLAPNRLSEALAAHRAAGKPLLDLTVSNPTECGFEYDGAAILSALSNPMALCYEPNPKGLEIARRAVAGYYADRGEKVSIEDIFLTTSTSEAYSYIFRTLCDPGDELLIPSPSYPLFDFLADIHDVRLVRYPLIYDHGWQMDFHEMERAIRPRTRGVIVVHPNNPTGHLTKVAEKRQLNAISSGRGLAILADEVFLDYPMGGAQARSFAANSEALTFTLSGLSKISGLPQMKAAWLAVSGPDGLKEAAVARLEVIADTFLSMNAPVQLAMPTLMAQGSAFQRQVRHRTQANLAELDRQLAARGDCSRLSLDGGWYAVLQLPANCSGEELALAVLREQDIHVHPGHYYDFATDRFLVLSLLPEGSTFTRGLAGILTRLP
jgi:aspartate/methionine/tyrosine aminotransferase